MHIFAVYFAGIGREEILEWDQQRENFCCSIFSQTWTTSVMKQDYLSYVENHRVYLCIVLYNIDCFGCDRIDQVLGLSVWLPTTWVLPEFSSTQPLLAARHCSHTSHVLCVPQQNATVPVLAGALLDLRKF